MFRRICSVKWIAIMGVTLFAASLADAKPPKTPPPPPQPNLGGVIYFFNGGQIWQMNGNGGEKAPAVLPLGFVGRPSSRLYDGARWWLCPIDMDGDGQTTDFDLFAFRFRDDGSFDEVRLTNVTDFGYSVSWNWDEVQWSNDGKDSFCSVLVCDPTQNLPYHRWNLWRFPTMPELFGSYDPMTLTGAVDEFALDFENSFDTAGVIDSSWWIPMEYSWSPSGKSIAYSHPLEGGNYKLRIKTLDPSTSYIEVPLSLHKVEKLSNVSWSPNGEWICFYAWIRGTDGVLRYGDWTVRPDGSGLTQLYQGYSGHNGGKKWSLVSDVPWVTYEDTNNSAIFLIKPDKSQGPYNLTSDLPTSRRNPEKRELIDWVGTEDVPAMPLP